MKQGTTIKIEKTTLQSLKSLKKYPRETHNDILIRLIKEELNPDPQKSGDALLSKKEDLVWVD
jgi:hypothetical protein